MHIRFVLCLFAAACLPAFAAPVGAEEAPSPSMSRKTVLEQEVDLASPHVKAKVLRVTFPQGYKTPLHTHEGPGPRYVLKGKVKIEDNGKSAVYGPGEAFWETGQPMSAENAGEGEAELLIFEMAPPK
jgi:quercetin dioxygenase-like cupin family protein